MTTVAVPFSILLIAALFPQTSSSPCEYSISLSALLTWEFFTLAGSHIETDGNSKVGSFSCFLWTGFPFFLLFFQGDNDKFYLASVEVFRIHTSSVVAGL